MKNLDRTALISVNKNTIYTWFGSDVILQNDDDSFSKTSELGAKIFLIIEPKPTNLNAIVAYIIAT
jgi:hypothetical protein